MTTEGSAQGVQESLKEVMRGFPQGVTVVTTKANGRLWGITVSSFTTVSLVPPIVLVSLMKNNYFSDAFASATGFAVNFLADNQKSISDRFAGRTPLVDRFKGLPHHSDGDAFPVVEGVVGFLQCQKWREYDGGDHILLLGEVLKAKRLNHKAPLVYYMQQYTTVVPPQRSASSEDVLW